MTVGDLIKKLAEFDLKQTVIVSCDAEGNGFGNLEDVEGCRWDPVNAERYSLDDEPRRGLIPAVCLWP